MDIAWIALFLIVASIGFSYEHVKQTEADTAIALAKIKCDVSSDSK